LTFPVRIHRFEEEEGTRFKAATSVDRLSKVSIPVERQLEAIEMAYSIALAGAREAIRMSTVGEKTDPRAFWLVGRQLKEFGAFLEEMGFYLDEETSTFSRDLGIPESSLAKIRAFHGRLPGILQIDPAVSWNKYRENKVSLPKVNRR